MPIGNVNSVGKKDNFRPPWVKDKDAAETPAWMQKRLKPVESAKTAEEEATGTVKPLRPGIRKQATIRENGVSETSDEKLIKPSPAKLSDKSKFTKSALKSIEKIPKLEGKLSIDDKSSEKPVEKIPEPIVNPVPEKPALRTVRTIDDRAKEKTVPIVDKKPVEKNSQSSNNITNDTATRPKPRLNNKFNKPTVTSNDKPVNKTEPVVEKPLHKVNSILEKPLNKVNTLTSDRSVNKTNSAVISNDKPVNKTDKENSILEKPLNKVNTVTSDRPVNKINSAVNEKIVNHTNSVTNEKPLNKISAITKDKSTIKPEPVVEKPLNKLNSRSVTNEKPEVKANSNANDRTVTKPAEIINDKPVANNVKSWKKSPVKETAVNDSPSKEIEFVKLRKVETKPKPVDKEEVNTEEKMATKPPTPLEKTPSKLPPRKPSLVKQASKDEPVKKWRDPLHERVKENIDKTLANEVPKGHTLTKNESLRSLLKPAPPPMPPPLPPKMPPPPEFKKAPLDPSKLKKIEQLKSRPRRRPDWSDMMKEVEQGRKLKKVVCNDRSSPIITKASLVKNKDQFIFESEKATSHNLLLKEIASGVKLKKTKTNDRSKPILEGLRKFRRQMTIEEQVQKSMSQANLAASPSGVNVAEQMAQVPTEEEEIDEMDDIDKVRDDLQSTKQLLAIELRNKEAQERENKRLKTRIQNLEAELARERAIIKQEQHKTVISVTDAYDERLVNNLKMEVEKTKENSDDLEKKYLDAAEERDTALTELEEVKRQNAELEKKLQQALSLQLEDMSISDEPLSFYQKRQLDFEKQCRLLDIDVDSEEAHCLRKSAANNHLAYNAYTNADQEGIMPTNVGSRRSSHAIKQLSITRDDSFEEESESEPEEEESEEKKQKRMEKEIKNMRNRIRHFKEKQDNMKRERMAYKMSLKNNQAALKDEKKKYKELKREVDKMAAMMKEVGSDEDEEEESEEESEEEKKSESEEEETETETEQDTESETESESEPEDAPVIKKKENLTTRLKRHETRVNALKKGNALLMANVDRMKDDVLKQKEESMQLQKELDSLIDDLE